MRVKNIALILLIFLLAILFAAMLNFQVSTRQGVNYRVASIKIPLYLKMLDFFDRHYNYKALVDRITEGAQTDEEKALKVFEWTYLHIRPQPNELPIVDDHVWSIIIRGYGAGEQSSDVFTTLCNYIRVDSFYYWLQPNHDKRGIVLSFIKIRGKWVLLDQYRGIFFVTKDDKLASTEDIIKGNWKIKKLYSEIPDFNYVPYFSNLTPVNKILVRR